MKCCASVGWRALLQYFCGEEFFHHGWCSMLVITRWRTRVGEDGYSAAPGESVDRRQDQAISHPSCHG